MTPGTETTSPSLSLDERSAILDPALVALTLSAVARLQQTFMAASSDSGRQVALVAAAELMDRTVCSRDLTRLMASPEHVTQARSNPLPLLVQHRDQVALTPPALWHPGRASPNMLGEVAYKGWRALTRAQRAELSDLPRLSAALTPWLSPAWGAHPELKAECLALLSRESI